MKRLWALIILTLFIGAAAPQAAGYNVTGKVSVEISPSSELLSVVYYLAFGHDPFVVDRNGYLDEVDSYFAPYRNHRAVQMLQEYLENTSSISERDLRLFYTEYYLLLCTEPPELRPWGGINDAWTLDFIEALRDFAKESDFMAFYRTHQNYYWEDLWIYTNALSLLPPDEFLSHYTDVSNVRFEFQHPFLVAIHGHSFSPVRGGTQIYGAGGMVPLVRRDPQRTLWSHKTARDTVFGLPLNRDYVNNTALDELIYLGFVYHELGHDITLPGLYANYGDTYSLAYLEEAIEEDMPYLARYDIHFWDRAGMIYEGFADGWADFALLHVDSDYSALAMWMQRGWGEFWIDEVLRIYEKYATLSQKNGVSLEEYVDDMLAELRKSVPPEVAEDMYQQRVPVTPLRAFDRGAVTGKVVVVYGTQNPDPRGTEYDRETAELIADSLRTFYSQWNGSVEIVVKADVNVTEDELGENLVLVGGPVANSVVAEMQGHFPLRFVKEGGHWVIDHNINWSADSFIITENESDPVLRGQLDLFDDHTASLLVAVRNPSNPANYIVWIAGADRYGTRLFRNPTYYLSSYEIFTGKEIEMGFYVQPLSPS